MNYLKKKPTTMTPENWMPAAVRADDRAERIREEFAATYDPRSDEHSVWRERVQAAIPAHAAGFLTETRFNGFAPRLLTIFQDGRTRIVSNHPGEEERTAEFRDAHAQIVSELDNSPSRRWELYVTLRAIEAAATEAQAAVELLAAERLRKAEQECPVCGHDDAARIGWVTHRPLPLGRQIRTCELCYAAAVALHATAAAEEPASSGMTTRGEAVRALLMTQAVN